MLLAKENPGSPIAAHPLASPDTAQEEEKEEAATKRCKAGYQDPHEGARILLDPIVEA